MEKNHLVITIILALGLIVGTVEAADRYSSGAKTWDTTTANWGTASGGPYTAATWNNATPDSAVFEGTAGTVTLGEGITVGGLTFNTATYTVTSNTLTFGAAGTISNAVNATIASALSGTGPITKNGAGTLTLSGNNSYTGGTIINAGTVAVATTAVDKNAVWGANGGALTFNGTASVDLGLRSGAGVTLNRGVTVNGGVNASIWLYHGSATISGAVTGNGTLKFLGDSGTAYLNANTFTGPLQIDRSGVTGPGPMYVYVASLADSANPITFLSNSGGASAFGQSSAAVASLAMTNRWIELAASGNLENPSASYALTVSTDLLVTGAGAKTLGFNSLSTSTGAVKFNGRIADGTGAPITVSKNYGTVYLSGTNTYSGSTENYRNGTLVFQGGQALPAGTTINMNAAYLNNPALTLLDDGAGMVTLGNNVNIRSTGNTYPAYVTFTVGNNNTANGGTSGGTTTGSTLVLGNLTINDTSWATLYGAQITINGANGYRLQFGNVNLPVVGTSGYNVAFIPTTAPVTITGTVKQINGNAAAKVFPLELAGTAAGNLVSGVIPDPADYPANANARPLSVIKSGASTWTLSNNNTYSGTTTNSGGKLIVNGSLPTNTVTVSAGFLGGTGTVNGAVTVSSTGGIDLRDGAVATLTVSNNLAITGSAGANNLHFDLASAGSMVDKIAATGAFSMTTPGAGVININQLGGSGNRLAAGTYDLITAASGMTAGGGNFALATTRAFGHALSLTGTTTALQLTTVQVAGAVPTAYWKGGNVNWSTAANWNTDATSSIGAGAAPDYQSNVRFYTTTPAATTLGTGVLDVDFDINSLTFDATSTAAVTIGGTKTLTIEAAAANGNTEGNGITLNNASGTHTISAKVGLAASQTWTVNSGATLAVSGVISDFGGGYGLTKAGGGNLTLTGATTYTGGTMIAGGILTVNATSLGAINNSPLTLSGGGRLTVSAANIASASQISVESGGGLISVSGNNNFTASGKLTGSGTLTLVDPGGGGGKAFNFNARDNDFTGGIILSGAAGLTLSVNSLADSANNIAFTAASGSVPFSYGSGATVPLTLVSRAFEINSAGALTGTIQNNNTVQTISIGANLVATGAGAKVIVLDAVAGPVNVFSGNITDGTGGGTVALSKTGAGLWALSGNSTYSGGTTLSAGKLVANGANALGAGNVTVTAGTLQIDAADAMADTAVLRLPSASAVNLVMNANDTVKALYINGILQPNGHYTSSGLGSGWMTGSGKLTVGPVAGTLIMVQ